MQKLLGIVLTILFVSFMFPGTCASEKRMMGQENRSISKGYISSYTDTGEEKGRAYYDLGVFAYEDGDYKEAEDLLKKAVSLDPNSPVYNYYLGKTYMEMARYPEAEKYLNIASKTDPDISGLKYDLAFLNYKMADYKEAAKLFIEITREDPSNVLAYYHAGINLFEQKKYDKALNYFMHAANESPSIKTNAFYYIGICYLKTGKTQKALEKFEYVRDNAEPGPLKENASEWIEAAKKLARAFKPSNIYFKISSQYGNDKGFSVLDHNFHKRKEDHFFTEGYLSGRYNFLYRQNYTIGIGYDHYQTWDNDLDDYDITGSILNLYSTYALGAFTFGFRYIPSYYWLNSDSYLTRQCLKPNIVWKINENLTAKLSYSYFNNNYFDYKGRDGHTNEIFMDAYYILKRTDAYLFAGAGYEDNTASHPDHYYGQMKTLLGISMRAPLSLDLGLSLKYYEIRYDNTDSYFGIKRDDAKYHGSISLGRKFFFDWLDIIAEYHFTKNDSNIAEYDYKRQTIGISMAARY